MSTASLLKLSLLLTATAVIWSSANDIAFAASKEPTSLFVTVEQDGKPVSDLRAENFRILEGGDPRRVEAATPVGPASVVLLVENSLASWTYLNEVNAAMRGFLKNAPEEHSYALVSYGRRAEVEAALTKEARQVAAAYAGMKSSARGDVDAYDAVIQVLDEMEELNTRAVLIVISSGLDGFSRKTYTDTIKRAEATNVVIHTIALGGATRTLNAEGDVNQLDLRRGEMFLRALAERTGGECYCPSCEADFSSSMQQILASLGKQYELTYRREPSTSSGFVKIDVRAFRLADDVRHDYTVKARAGWRF